MHYSLDSFGGLHAKQSQSAVIKNMWSNTQKKEKDYKNVRVRVVILQGSEKHLSSKLTKKMTSKDTFWLEDFIEVTTTDPVVEDVLTPEKYISDKELPHC